MSDLEKSLQQLATTLQGFVLNDNHPVGKLFRILGELQVNMDASPNSTAEQQTLGQFQQQLQALDLDDEQKSELQNALASVAQEEAAAASQPSNGGDLQVLNDLVKQVTHIHTLIKDPNVDPATALSTIRPFYEQFNTVFRNFNNSISVNGNTILHNLQNLLRNPPR